MKVATRAATTIEPGEFKRPTRGYVWTSKEVGLPLTGLSAWHSNGGADRDHPDRRRPFLLEVFPPRGLGHLTRIHIAGIFGLHAACEAPGTLGASIALGNARDPVLRLNLVSQRHYFEASDLRPLQRLTGDGACLETIGQCVIDGRPMRVDVLTIDVPQDTRLETLRFRDLGTPASFVIFDVLYEYVGSASCPFKSRSGGVALGELAAVVRIGDRVRLRKAMAQLEDAVLKTDDLDEAKGQALTFIAVVTAATLEMGGSRTMHSVQLQAARRLESLFNREEIVTVTRSIVEDVAQPLESGANPSSILIDRALNILNRNFARNLGDADLAGQLGLSTSHFRYLFKEVTGQPFHKYLIALRLERARQLLLEGAMPVSDVATAVGFNGLAHFSRAFAQRFSVTPKMLRRKGTVLSE